MSTSTVTVAELAERMGADAGAVVGGRHRATRGAGVSRTLAGAVAGAALSGGIAFTFAPTASAQSVEQPQVIEAIQNAANAHGINGDVIQQIADQFGVAPTQVQQYAGDLGFDLGSLGLPIPGLGGAHTPAHGPVTSGFGPRWGTNHNGTDFGAPHGSPMYAAKSGTVEAAGPASGYGLWIRIRTDDGELLEYGHNDQNYVSAGQRVHAGQVIGTVGNRGHSTGPHLHFGVQNQAGQWIDPVPWLVANGVVV